MKWSRTRWAAFEKARVTLTAYYLVSLLLIIFVFTLLTFQAKESAFIRVRNTVDEVISEDNAIKRFQQSFDETNQNFQERLIVADTILILLAAGFSLWMSGRTLAPIQAMLQLQKEFAADVSHELKTPLSNISLEIQTARRIHRLNPQIATLLVSIEEEVSRMTHMVQGLLLLVRSQQGSIDAVNEEVDLSTVIYKSVHTMTPLAEQKSLALIVGNPLPKAHVWGDREQLLQVILILIDNAIKYSPSDTTITIGLDIDQSGGQIIVADQGVGIPEQDQEAIFDRFYRSHAIGDVKIKGSGLGLAIAKRIIDLHAGTIRLKSEVGKGTSFYVRLPLMEVSRISA